MTTKNHEARARRLCGCGTCGEALDAAFRVIAAEKDCYHWHQTVDSLVTIIRGNLLGRTMVADGVPAFLVGEQVNGMIEKEHDRAQAIADANSEELIELCDAIWEKIQLEGKTQ